MRFLSTALLKETQSAVEIDKVWYTMQGFNTRSTQDLNLFWEEMAYLRCYLLVRGTCSSNRFPDYKFGAEYESYDLVKPTVTLSEEELNVLK